MKALILNSGQGSRIKSMTQTKPKCLIQLKDEITIFQKQVEALLEVGITDIVITTGYKAEILQKYAIKTFPTIKFRFINNKQYKESNYIYSIYLAREYLSGDIVLLHGDLVFDSSILKDILKITSSAVVINTEAILPQKDFKAVVKKDRVLKIGTEFFANAFAAQPLYKLNKEDWKQWLKQIIIYCEQNQNNCYAEVALNDILERFYMTYLDVKGKLCQEIDIKEDLENVIRFL